MSEWYTAGKDDIELDRDDEEANIFVCTNDFGNVYVTITFAQIKELASMIEVIDCRHGMPLSWSCNACSDSGDDPRKPRRYTGLG